MACQRASATRYFLTQRLVNQRSSFEAIDLDSIDVLENPVRDPDAGHVRNREAGAGESAVQRRSLVPRQGVDDLLHFALVVECVECTRS